MLHRFWVSPDIPDYKLLPALIASHFNGAGVANGWSSKESFFIFYWVILAVALGLSFGLSSLLRILPPSQINLPNRDYWLAPERIDDTISFLRRQFKWFSAMLMAFLLVVFQLVIIANLPPGRQLNNLFIYLLVAFIASTIVWAVRMATRFYRV